MAKLHCKANSGKLERADDTLSVATTISTEIVAGFRAWPVWMVLGWDDIRQRYRRVSILGPFLDHA